MVYICGEEKEGEEEQEADCQAAWGCRRGAFESRRELGSQTTLRLCQLGAVATARSKLELRVQEEPSAGEHQVSSSSRAQPLRKLSLRLDVAAVELTELGVAHFCGRRRANSLLEIHRDQRGLSRSSGIESPDIHNHGRFIHRLCGACTITSH